MSMNVVRQLPAVQDYKHIYTLVTCMRQLAAHRIACYQRKAH